MRRPARLIPGLVLVAAAGLGGFFASRMASQLRGEAGGLTPTAEAPASRETAEAELDTGSLPPAVAPRPVPERMPDVRLADEQGRLRSLSEWRGRPLLVNFWATWCAPCRREIPLLMDLRRERAASRLEVIGIAVDFRDAVLEYAREIRIDYPLLIGEQDGLDAVDAFGMDMLFPFTVFADRAGRIVAVKVGELHRDEADFILDRVEDLDAGRIELDLARQQIAARLRELATRRAKAASGPAVPGRP